MHCGRMSILVACIMQAHAGLIGPQRSASSMQSPWIHYRPQVRHGVAARVATKTAPSTAARTPLWDKADEEKVAAWAPTQVVDEAAKLSASDFPIKPDDLIMKAKIFLAYDLGVGKPDLLSKDFEFVGPVVGPLSKEKYVKAVGGFNLGDSFPDKNDEWHHFRVDPFELNRVWFTARGRGTQTGGKDPSGKAYVQPPQACSVRFDPDGKINQWTIGYVMDKRIGNTGGLGGVFGIAYAMGNKLPFPEANPWKPSKRYRFFTWLGDALQSMRSKKKESPSESATSFMQNSHYMVSIPAAAAGLLISSVVAFALHYSRRGALSSGKEALLATQN